MSDLKYIYGPVPSWRLGRSLGIDLISKKNTCTFDCVYCQLGPTQEKTDQRQVFVPTKDIIKEFDQVPKNVGIDFVTFSGTGEPTLAKNLGEVIMTAKKHFDRPIAVLTNASLMHLDQVRKALSNADLVVAKLDAPDNETLQKMNRPLKEVKFDLIIEGIKKFNQEYPGKLALQTMFLKQNKDKAWQMAELAKEIAPAEVQINTPLRPSGVEPLPKEELKIIEDLFKPLKTFMVYDAKKPQVEVLDLDSTLKRRPKL